MMASILSLRLLAALALSLVIITTVPASLFAQSEQREWNGVPKDWLIEPLTVADAEARHTLPPDDRAERFPELKKPFGFMNAEWEKLKRQMQPGDQLWTWGHEPGAGGLALVRNGEVVASIMTWIN